MKVEKGTHLWEKENVIRGYFIAVFLSHNDSIGFPLGS